MNSVAFEKLLKRHFLDLLLPEFPHETDQLQEMDSQQLEQLSKTLGLYREPNPVQLVLPQSITERVLFFLIIGRLIGGRWPSTDHATLISQAAHASIDHVNESILELHGAGAIVPGPDGHIRVVCSAGVDRYQGTFKALRELMISLR